MSEQENKVPWAALIFRILISIFALACACMGWIEWHTYWYVWLVEILIRLDATLHKFNQSKKESKHGN